MRRSSDTTGALERQGLGRARRQQAGPRLPRSTVVAQRRRPPAARLVWTGYPPPPRQWISLLQTISFPSPAMVFRGYSAAWGTPVQDEALHSFMIRRGSNGVSAFLSES